MFSKELHDALRATLTRRNGESGVSLLFRRAYGAALTPAERDELGVCARIALAAVRPATR